ncbi:MAG: hypothetical protein UD961_00790 [Bacteroidales bacterium]|nr:hypothetical protein [Bacteroidales bacterium]
MVNILYIHGMGGGGDSRIPAILRETLSEKGVNVVVRTYDFDPEIGSAQIEGWMKELEPSLVIGESMGSIHALRIKGVPHILISPSLNAPFVLGRLCWLSLIPGVTPLLDRIYRPKEGDRQKLHFTYDVLRKYVRHGKTALASSSLYGNDDFFFAFFGTRDHYRRTGIVSVRSWKKYFGENYMMYEGTHFTEEEHIFSKVIPMICNILDIR